MKEKQYEQVNNIREEQHATSEVTTAPWMLQKISFALKNIYNCLSYLFFNFNVN